MQRPPHDTGQPTTNCARRGDNMIAIIPQPVSLKPGQGRFALDGATSIVADPAARAVAEYAAARLGAPYGRPLTVSESAGGDPVIGYTIDPACDPPSESGYRLSVEPARVDLRAKTPLGLVHGTQTLRQLQHADHSSLPACEIVDYPRFDWRGSLLDACRHFWSVADTKRYIDLLALYKMNVLHWHLTEDQGWRIESKAYPRLTEIAAWRDDGHGGTYGGFYTQDEIRDVVAYAAARGITIVPEVEMPGHSVAALAAYPDLACTGGPFEVRTAWGVSEDIYCAGNEKVFTFLETILDEVMSLFPSKHIHIGGDESPKQRWEACPRCQQRIRDESLRDEFELQKYFINRIERFLASHGKVLIGWDEILETRAAGVGHETVIDYDESGGALALTRDAVVQSWRGIEGGTAAARSGHDVIMSPTTHCYLDYSVEHTTTEKSYSFEPVPAELSAEEAARILGLEGNVWTERIADRDRWDYMVFPRLCALAEAGWSPAATRSWRAFRERLQAHDGLLESLDVKYWRDPS
ncbi:MAG: family 20 glycosylhydrolase, partial [Chitinivibrionales bacterium]|nr:family 20 glycosylhydrolase [Chitinivibrionales bacterium]